MYNFLDSKLMPKVTSSAPSTDNFEETNLISDKDAIRSRGFLAYTVIRPPVDLEFEFLCPIEIFSVLLQTTVGRQRSTGIEIFAKSEKSLYISMAKATFETPGVTFCSSQKYPKGQPPEFHDSQNSLFYFKNDNFRIIRDVKFLKVVIFRTDKSVPCLGSVKVFGKPSKSCSETTIQTINRLMGVVHEPTAQVHNTQKTDLVPQDFIDDLTCEIMTLPMTLPSGKTVDRDTLEKHIENEKCFGRKPCDPFTGLNFTESRKPILNVALKSRIDMFLMQNSNKPFTFNLKRTIGSDLKNCKKIKNYNCCVCHQSDHLYVIPCEHYFCRTCLLVLKSYKCGSCGKEFVKNQAVKYHAK